MNPDDFIEIGYVARAHGMKGEVRAVFGPRDLIDLDEFEELPVHYLQSEKGNIQPLIVEQFGGQNDKQLLIKYEGIEAREAAEKLVGSTLLFPKEELTEMEEGYFYYYEVIGFQVVDSNLGKLGEVTGFSGGKIHDIMVMDYQGFEVLVPVVDHIVGKADFDKKEVYTTLPEGLLEIYTNQDEEEDEG